MAAIMDLHSKLRQFKSLKIHEFPAEGLQNNPVVFLCPHCCDGKSFYHNFPELFQYSPHNNIIPEFLFLEHDWGTLELALNAARCLSRNGLSCRVVEIRFPRGILDANRHPDFCAGNCHTIPLRNIFKDLPEEIKSALLSLHKKAVNKILETIQSCVCVVDVHSMAIHSPKDNFGDSVSVCPETPDSIPFYMKNTIEAQGEKRIFNILTCFSDKTPVTSDVLRHGLCHALRKRGYTVGCNRTYFLSPYLMTTKYAQMGIPLLVPEIPKHYLAKNEDLLAPEPDPEHFRRISASICEAVHFFLSPKIWTRELQVCVDALYETRFHTKSAMPATCPRINRF
jgi:hypothetical protein